MARRKVRPVLADDEDVARPSPRARLRTRLAAVALALVALAAFFGVGAGCDRPAGAQENEVIDDPRLDPSLAGVQVDGDGYRKALAAWRSAASHLADAEDRLAKANAETDAQTGERDRLNAEIAEAQRARHGGAEALQEHRDSLRAVAVASYVQGARHRPPTACSAAPRRPPPPLARTRWSATWPSAAPSR